MNFDFYNQYQNLSNTDLLKIVHRPEEYQADAIAAATRLLSERNITDDEIEQAKKYYVDIDTSAKQKADRIRSYKDKAADFFEPALNPASELKPDKWLQILLLVIGLQYLWTLYINLTHIVAFVKFVTNCKDYSFDSASSQPVTYWTCFTNQFDIVIFLEFLTLIYVPVIFYLLYKRRRWSWILLFADTLFGFIATVSQSHLFFRYQQIHHGNTFSFLIQVIIKGVFAFFLWRNSITDFFGVNKETKNKTALLTSIFTAVFIIGIQLFL